MLRSGQPKRFFKTQRSRVPRTRRLDLCSRGTARTNSKTIPRQPAVANLSAALSGVPCTDSFVLESKFSSFLRRRRQGSFALDYGLLPGVFCSPGFGGIKFYVRLEFSRNVVFGVNGFDGACRNASGAIDAINRIDDQLLFEFVKATHRADFHAISEPASVAFVGNDVWHTI